MTDLKLVNPFTVLAGSLTFVAGLAWNEAVQSGINEYYPDRNAFRAKLVYAVVVTLLITMIVMLLKYANDTATEIAKNISNINRTRKEVSVYA
jgi:hypothetical protein